MEKDETNKTKSEYIPGVCNIGPAERRARKMVGFGGLPIFLPASMGATGFLQWGSFQ